MLKKELFALLAVGAVACDDVEGDDDGHSHSHSHGLITAVDLSFTAASDGSNVVYRWSDAEDDGSPEIDDIVLVDGEAYDLEVFFYNELEEPVEDVTPDILDQGDEHQIFFTGSAVESDIVDHGYEDEDSKGLPLGLDNVMDSVVAGNGDLTIILQHLPEENDSPTKTEGLEDQVANGGIGSIGGDTDVSATFNLTVE
ncbi:MAG: hypothetical protein AAFV53_35685 [Myxococcota bacterium]